MLNKKRISVIMATCALAVVLGGAGAFASAVAPQTVAGAISATEIEVAAIALEEPMEVAAIALEEPMEVAAIALEEPVEVAAIALEASMEMAAITTATPCEMAAIAIEAPMIELTESIVPADLLTESFLVKDPK